MIITNAFCLPRKKKSITNKMVGDRTWQGVVDKDVSINY